MQASLEAPPPRTALQGHQQAWGKALAPQSTPQSILSDSHGTTPAAQPPHQLKVLREVCREKGGETFSESFLHLPMFPQLPFISSSSCTLVSHAGRRPPTGRSPVLIGCIVAGSRYADACGRRKSRQQERAAPEFVGVAFSRHPPKGRREKRGGARPPPVAPGDVPFVEHGTQAPRRLNERVIPGEVAACIVDLLEMIDINYHEHMHSHAGELLKAGFNALCELA